MKSIKKFLKCEACPLMAAFIMFIALMMYAFIDAIMRNQHPTSEQITMVIFIELILAAMEIVFVVLMVNEYRDYNN